MGLITADGQSLYIKKIYATKLELMQRTGHTTIPTLIRVLKSVYIRSKLLRRAWNY